MFQPGRLYQKLGVILSGLEPSSARQLSLMDPDQSRRSRERSLMEALDRVNKRYGRDTIRIGLTGSPQVDWEMRRKFLSRRFTTSWDELPTAG